MTASVLRSVTAVYIVAWYIMNNLAKFGSNTCFLARPHTHNYTRTNFAALMISHMVWRWLLPKIKKSIQKEKQNKYFFIFKKKKIFSSTKYDVFYETHSSWRKNKQTNKHAQTHSLCSNPLSLSQTEITLVIFSNKKWLRFI